MNVSFRVLGGKEDHVSAFVVLTANDANISEHLATDSEIDNRISRLKDELDSIAKQAKTALKDAR